MSTQSALVKAFGQQGFFKDGKETAQIKWERRENAELERLCRQANIEGTRQFGLAERRNRKSHIVS